MAKIIDINKIGEKGKIDISNLKMILKEVLVEISENEENNNNLETDISLMLELLYKKGFLRKEEVDILSVTNCVYLEEGSDNIHVNMHLHYSSLFSPHPS